MTLLELAARAVFFSDAVRAVVLEEYRKFAEGKAWTSTSDGDLLEAHRLAQRVIERVFGKTK